MDLQGHGRTADIDRPITYEQMADDAAALMDTLGVAQADVFGYSMGGGVAYQLAIRHPEKVRRLAAASATYKTDGMYPELVAMISGITPEAFAGSPMEAEYKKLAPKPEDFPKLVAKLVKLDIDAAGLAGRRHQGHQGADAGDFRRRRRDPARAFAGDLSACAAAALRPTS